MQNMIKRLRELKAKYKNEKRPPKPRPIINPDKHGVNDTLVLPENPKPVDLTVLKRPDGVKPAAAAPEVAPKLPLEVNIPGNLGNSGVPKPAARVSVRPPTPLPPGGIHRVGFQRPARGSWLGSGMCREIGDNWRDDTQRREEGGESGDGGGDVSAGY